MITRKYKFLYDVVNVIMIYMLALGLSIAASTGMRTNFSYIFAIGGIVVLGACVAMRVLIPNKLISIVGHIVLLGILFVVHLPTFDKYTLLAFAALLTILDINDFEKRRQSSYGELHIISCVVFLVLYAYTDAVYRGFMVDEKKPHFEKAALFSLIICLLGVIFFVLALIRSYLSNAMKLVDNSHLDEFTPVVYMYGNSNKFIGPIIALIAAIMLVVQSSKSANILSNVWESLMKGTATICNALMNTGLQGSTVATVGSTPFIVELILATLVILIVVALIIWIAVKIYKSHWRKDESKDETLESAAMVEKREWIYHKESKKKPEDTSVTQAAEIPTEIEKTETQDEAVEETVEAAEETVEAVEEAEEEKTTEE